MKKALCFALCAVHMSCAIAKDETQADAAFVFLVYFNTTAPFAYRDDQQQRFVGVIPDIVREAASLANIRLEFRYASRKGAEQAIYDNLADGIMLAVEWAEYPDMLLFSDPMFVQREFLYSLTPFASGSDMQADMAGKVVCTRQNYKYPAVQSIFEQGLSFRNDLSTHAEMLDMLLQKRCDLAYLSEFRARWLLLQQVPEKRVFRSDYTLDQIGLTIAVHPRHARFLASFNQYVRGLKQSGRMQEILNAHLDKRRRQLTGQP